jgi:hypothetical protein
LNAKKVDKINQKAQPAFIYAPLALLSASPAKEAKPISICNTPKPA